MHKYNVHNKIDVFEISSHRSEDQSFACFRAAVYNSFWQRADDKKCQSFG